MESFIASPISRKDIRKFTSNIRRELGVDNVYAFPIIHFLEMAMPSIDTKFNYVIKTVEEMGECHGLAHPDKHLIEIREDVYERACNGIGRDRFTIAHEIGHYFLHGSNRVALARIAPNKEIVCYRNPEWQADVFAGELLMPANLIKGKTPGEVSRLCLVSVSAAMTQLSKL